MSSCCTSTRASGPYGAQPAEVALELAVELATECADYAASLRRRVAFEFSLEAQDETIADADDYRCHMSPLITELSRRRDVNTAFVVAQTGTKVLDGCNIGVLNRDSTGNAEATQLRRLAALVRSLGCRLKAHNSDFLNRRAITMLRRHSVWMNISPELGSAQTRAVLTAAYARDACAHTAAEDFCSAAIESGYWRKWVSAAGGCTDAAKVELGVPTCSPRTPSTTCASAWTSRSELGTRSASPSMPLRQSSAASADTPTSWERRRSPTSRLAWRGPRRRRDGQASRESQARHTTLSQLGRIGRRPGERHPAG